ncbi:MAG: HAMP domain-containing histidine kinase [Nitrospirae bacterium]|nr:HAMP domain-containing histidine kinase [Nitrospirota bacterium]
MLRFNPSIQSKVKYGYYICLILISIIAIFNYLNLRTLDKKITFSFIISDIFDTALEMRRFEKNYFLYKDVKDYLENLRFTQKAEGIIHRNRESIKRLSPDTDVSAIEKTIAEYKTFMQEYFQQGKFIPPEASREFEAKIRTLGKKIVDVTEHISTEERTYVQSLVISSKRILLISVISVVIAGILMGQFFSRMVVKPLKQLEDNMQRIADGKFDKICIESPDSEIVSLGNACSRMLKELELRQKRFVMQSEKLASLGTMVSGVAHELNNPLSNIYSSCQILHEEIEEGDMAYKKEMLQQIEAEIERAKEMVHSLLEFSRKTTFKRKPYSLAFLVEDTIRLIHGDIPAKVEIEVDLPEEAWVFVDRQSIEQAFLNIIKNAIDSIPGDGKVSVFAEKDEHDKTYRINIRDNGIGIEPEKLEKIFDPFFTTKDEGKGSGLGLFITREIIEEHGGKILVRSAEGEGTTFTIILPAKEI